MLLSDGSGHPALRRRRGLRERELDGQRGRHAGGPFFIVNACISVCNRCGEGRSPSTPPRRLPRPSWSSSPASKLAILAVRYAHTLLLLVAAASASGCSHALIARSHNASRPCDAHAMASSLTCARPDCLRAGPDRFGSRWRLGSPSARRWFIALSIPDGLSRRLILQKLAGPPFGASAMSACTILAAACAAAMVAMDFTRFILPTVALAHPVPHPGPAAAHDALGVGLLGVL